MPEMSLDLHRIPRACAFVLAAWGVMFLMMGFRIETLDCSRVAASCTIVDGPPLLRQTVVLPAAEIRNYEFVRMSDTFGPWGATILTDRHDQEHRVGRNYEAAARGNYDAIVAFARDQLDVVELRSPPMLAFVLLGFALILAAPLPYWVWYRLVGRRPRDESPEA